METIDIKEFKPYYEKKIIPELDKIEAKRRSILTLLIVVTVGVLGSMPIVSYFLIKNHKELDELIYLVTIPMFCITMWAGMFVFNLINSTSFYKMYKRQIIGTLINYLNPNLHYDNKKMVHRKDYSESDIFRVPKAIQYEGDDHLSGKIGATSIEFSELKTKVRHSDGEGTMRFELQFHGIFFVAKTEEVFPFNIVIEPRKNKQKEAIKVIKTGNEVFDKLYSIRCITQPSESADIKSFLTDEILDNLIKYNKQFHNDLFLSFNYKNMYLAISHEKDLFEPHIWKSNKNFDDVVTHLKDLYFPIKFIEDMVVKKDTSKQEEYEMA